LVLFCLVSFGHQHENGISADIKNKSHSPHENGSFDFLITKTKLK
jgi:hypothetical protein